MPAQSLMVRATVARYSVDRLPSVAAVKPARPRPRDGCCEGTVRWMRDVSSAQGMKRRADS